MDPDREIAALPVDVEIAADGVALPGDLTVPTEPRGIVLFAHGSGSSRHSSRNRRVAAALHARRLATLLIDLLTADEERVDRHTAHLRFDIGLLARRLVGATDFLRADRRTRSLAIGYFGASTGGGAALVAAAARPSDVRAVVSRGGRPDLAGTALAEVRAPTLLIVGGEDQAVIALNQAALANLRCLSRLTIVPGATHLFEEPGALDRVAELAGEWLVEHLTHPSTASPHRPDAGSPRP